MASPAKQSSQVSGRAAPDVATAILAATGFNAGGSYAAAEIVAETNRADTPAINQGSPTVAGLPGPTA